MFVAGMSPIAAARMWLVPTPALQLCNSEKAHPLPCQCHTPCLGLADSTPAGNDAGIGWAVQPFVGQQGTGCCRFIEQGVGGRKTGRQRTARQIIAGQDIGR